MAPTMRRPSSDAGSRRIATLGLPLFAMLPPCEAGYAPARRTIARVPHATRRSRVIPDLERSVRLITHVAQSQVLRLMQARLSDRADSSLLLTRDSWKAESAALDGIDRAQHCQVSGRQNRSLCRPTHPNFG